MKKFPIVFIIIIIFFVNLAIFSEEDETFNDIQIIKVIWGEKLPPIELKNKIKIVYIWSIKEPQCKGFNYTFKNLVKKYKKYGVIFISIHSHDKDIKIKDIWKYCKKNKINFLVTFAGVGNIKIPDIYLPIILIFDSNDKLIYKNNPKNLKKMIHNLIRRSPHWLLGDKKKIKYLKYERKSIIKALIKNRGLGKIYKKLEKKLKKYKNENKEKRVEECKYLMEKIEEYFDTHLTLLNNLKENNPELFLEKGKLFWKLFKYMPNKKDEKKKFFNYIKSKEFKYNLKAYKIWKKLISLKYEINYEKYLNEDEEDINPLKILRDSSFRRTLPKIIKNIHILQKKYPDSKYAIKVEELLNAIKEKNYIKFLNLLNEME